LIEQLSPKGLALLSYIYAKKDNNVAQPIIASTYTDFKNLIKLFVDASSGVQCTVILQITDTEKPKSLICQHLILKAYNPRNIHNIFSHNMERKL
jgi:hypothetical protein